MYRVAALIAAVLSASMIPAPKAQHPLNPARFTFNSAQADVNGDGVKDTVQLTRVKNGISLEAFLSPYNRFQKVELLHYEFGENELFLHDLDGDGDSEVVFWQIPKKKEALWNVPDDTDEIPPVGFTIKKTPLYSIWEYHDGRLVPSDKFYPTRDVFDTAYKKTV